MFVGVIVEMWSMDIKWKHASLSNEWCGYLSNNKLVLVMVRTCYSNGYIVSSVRLS